MAVYQIRGYTKGQKWLLNIGITINTHISLMCDTFFASIKLSILIKKLREFIKDEWFIHLIEVSFTWHQKGLPLGFYLSQWLSNLMLDDLDWLIGKYKIKHVRYVDDVVMFGNNKRKLRRCFEEIKKLLGKSRLVVKENYHLYRTKESLSFLGFVFTEQQIRLRKNIARTILKATRRIRKSVHIWIKDARSLLSLMGWIKHSDSYLFYFNNIKPYISIKKLKRIVSKIERRNRNDKLDYRRFRPSTAGA